MDIQFLILKVSPSLPAEASAQAGITSLTVNSAIGHKKLDFVLKFYIIFYRMLNEGNSHEVI